MLNEIRGILLVEDSELDAERLLHELSRDGQVLAERVEDEAGFVETLRRFAPGLVVFDLGMPAFPGYRALEIARDLVPCTPFTSVSGTIGEEAAIEALRAGATLIEECTPARPPLRRVRRIGKPVDPLQWPTVPAEELGGPG